MLGASLDNLPKQFKFTSLINKEDIKYLKKGGKAKSKIIVPIRYASGYTKDHLFIIKAYNED